MRRCPPWAVVRMTGIPRMSVSRTRQKRPPIINFLRNHLARNMFPDLQPVYNRQAADGAA